MPSVRISKHNNNGVYFLTFTIRHWYYLLDKHCRWQILADCLTYLVASKRVYIYAYVFMINHIHLIIDSENSAGFVRDFKRHTTKELKTNIGRTEPKLLRYFAKGNSNEFWISTNMPLQIETEKFLLQKIEYIHNNPVRRQYVDEPEHWIWSSANPKSPIPIHSWI